jgi:hypothetical protein
MKGIRRLSSIALVACFTSVCVAQTGSLTCSSDDGSYHYCRANTGNQVRLTRQLPGPRCQQNYSWGFDYRGIWVDRGCRAQFEYGRAHSDSGTGSAVAAGILGAIILGAVAASNSDDNDRRADRQRDYYRDGYRLGQMDWDNNRPPFYMSYRNRFPPDHERDFAAGYDAGYNNRRDASYRNDYGHDSGWGPSWRGRQDAGTNDPNWGTINNPGHGVSGVEEKIITCSDNSGGGNHCSAITAGGVDMVRQRSGSPCRENYSWGVDQSGIWVSHGCRADFVLHGVAAN